MTPETRIELKKAEEIIRGVARDYEDFEESVELEMYADGIEKMVEACSN